MAEAPQDLHRHRMRPALVLPFFTSLDSHNSKVGKKTFAVSYYNQTPKKETCVKGGK